MTSGSKAARTEKARGKGEAGTPGFEALAGLNTEAFNTFDQVAQDMIEGLETCRQETARFFGHRLRQTLEMPQALASCLTPQEAFGVYLDYLRTAQKDYAEEALRLARLGSTVAESTILESRVETANDTD